MEITEVKVFPVRDKKLRAFASIVFDASFMVNDIKVIQGKDGLFISMPSRRQKNGRFKDIAHPLNQETRQVLEDRILAEFRRVAEGGEGAAEPEAPAAPRQRSEGRRRDAAQDPAAPQRPAEAETSPAAPPPAEPGNRPAARAPVPAAAPSSAAPAGASESSGAAEETSAAEPAADAADGEKGGAGQQGEEKSLEEVAEAHLSDSYWTT